ncbi:hypothetical protein [Amycolatopsis lexingtonensis]|uniref:hypothetical protein n=1 Tax=Amycolatopsis lexingtonensis TaxID=218822 RepID=UPI003F72A71C
MAEILLILGVPLAMLWMAVSTLANGTFAADGCDPLRIARLMASAADRPDLACTTVPFIADLPSLGLGLTSEAAVVLYLLLIRRMRQLDVSLTREGAAIFDKDQLSQDPMRARYGRFLAKLRVRAVRQLLVFAGVTALGTWFYLSASQSNHLFKTMANIQGVTYPTIAVQDGYRLSWWAQWDTDPSMAILWIAVGSIGTYFAARQAYLYYHIARLFKDVPKLMVFRHVPARIDRDHGWRPVGRLIVIAYLSSLCFVCSLIVLIFILRDPDQAPVYRTVVNVLLGVVAFVGTGLNLAVVGTLRSGIRRSYVKALKDRIIRLNQESAELDNTGQFLAARTTRLEADHLVGDAGYPIRGGVVRMASLASGLIPVVKLTHDVINLYF